MAERALDVQEIQNVMAMHQLYGSPGGDHSKEIELIWAHKTPGVSFAGNNHIVQGDIEVIKKFYAPTESTGRIQEPAPGNTSFRTLPTPIIEVAGDGKTAKGFWYTPGWSVGVRDGKGNSSWSYEKYGVDFVKEDGKWKIWHIGMYYDNTPPGWGATGAQPEQAEAAPVGAKPEDLEEIPTIGGLEMTSPNPDPYKAWSPTTVPRIQPRFPEPYYTFSETFSY